jgi:hypothetical protein
MFYGMLTIWGLRALWGKTDSCSHRVYIIIGKQTIKNRYNK